MRIRRYFLTVLMGCLVLCGFSSVASAHDESLWFGVRGGYYTKIEKPFIGAELLVGVAPHFYFNPNIEYVFVDSGSYITFNGDFHYDFPTHSSTYVWLGAGLAVVRDHPEGFAASTDVAANIFGGIGFRSGGIIPYIQAKAVIKNDSLAVLCVGLRF
jgi:hypothetical protein